MQTRSATEAFAAPAAQRPKPLARRLFDADDPWAVNAGRVVALLLLFGLWELGAGRLFDIFYFSKPSLIVAQFAKEIVDPAFYLDLWVTGMELVLGYASGAAAGIALGILLARWRDVAKICDPFLLALNSVPRIAVAPMLIIWFGIGIASKVFLAATLVFFITFFNTLSGIRGVDRALCDVARVQGANEWQIFTKVMLPHASAWILTGLKMSLPFGLVGVILGEFLVSSKGLGFRLNSYATSYNTSGAITMILLMMFLMMALTAVADRIDARVMRWRPSDRETGGVAPESLIEEMPVPLDRIVIPPPAKGLDMAAQYGWPQSTAIRAGDYVFVSGVTAIDPASGERMQGTVTSEAHRVFQNLKLVLEAAGSSLDRLVQVHAGIYDRIEYDALNRVYRQYVPEGPPARTVWSIQIIDGFKVQLDAIAVV